MGNIRKARTDSIDKKSIAKEVYAMNTKRKEVFFLILIEYLIGNYKNNDLDEESLGRRLRAYYRLYVEYKKTHNPEEQKIMALSKSTLYKILKGDDTITVSSLKLFAYMIADSGCPLPSSRFEMLEICKNCTFFRFMTKVIGLIKEESWILNFII